MRCTAKAWMARAARWGKGREEASSAVSAPVEDRVVLRSATAAARAFTGRPWRIVVDLGNGAGIFFPLHHCGVLVRGRNNWM